VAPTAANEHEFDGSTSQGSSGMRQVAIPLRPRSRSISFGIRANGAFWPYAQPLTAQGRVVPCKKQQEAERMKLGSAWANTGLVFTTRTGMPIEPRNLVRSFVRIRDSHGIRKIRLHAIRHTTASLLKDLGVPARDTQIILGTRISRPLSRSTPTWTKQPAARP
jgi:integrase